MQTQLTTLRTNFLKGSALQSASFWIGVIVIARAILQIIVIEEYGYFIDEHYYIACARKLDWGYVDHPPLSIWLLAAVRFVLGESLWAMRLPMLVAAVCLIWISAAIARELGGSQFARILTALLVAFVPVYLGMFKFYSMNGWDLCFWSLALYYIIRLIHKASLANWITLGLIFGLGLLNKHSLIFLGFAFACGILLSNHRRWLLSSGPYLCATLALLIFSPNLIWQIAYDWPTLEFMHNARTGKHYFTVLHFLKGQVLEIHPLFAPVWLTGLVTLIINKSLRPYRILAWIYLILLILFLMTDAKTYYLAPMYPVLLAVGSIWFAEISTSRTAARVIALLVMVVSGILLLPMSTPILPPDSYLKYQTALGIAPPRMERHAVGPMPQHFADMFGWPELRRSVTEIYHNLPQEIQSSTVILGANYGYAGALQHSVAEADLPAAGSPHNQYYLWGPPLTENGKAASHIILVGFDQSTFRPYCNVLENAGTIRCGPHCLPHRQNREIAICKPIRPLSEIWPELKMFM